MPESVESEPLFEEPSVRDERGGCREVFKPNMVNMIEVNAEFFLNDLRLRLRDNIRLHESFSESVNGLVMFVFEFGLSE